MELVTAEGLRQDGRRAGELRRLRCRLGVLGDADGSALLDSGATKVLAAVYGPREVPQRGDAQHDRCVIRVDFTFAAFATGEARRGPRRDRRATEWSQQVRGCLEAVVLSELLPRSSLLVTLTLLSADGSARAAALNAALLALADAGVPLRDTCGAACAALLDGCPCVDPSRAEEGQGVSQLCLALLPATQTLPLLLQEGARCSLEALPRLLEAAQQGAQATAAFMRRTLVDRAKARAAAMHVC